MDVWKKLHGKNWVGFQTFRRKNEDVTPFSGDLISSLLHLLPWRLTWGGALPALLLCSVGAFSAPARAELRGALQMAAEDPDKVAALP